MANYDLERFKQAQEDVHGVALAELHNGRKRSHWIWYVFPQLTGLGSSAMAVRYGLRGLDEARAYLNDPLLRGRYHEALLVVHEQVVERRLRLERLMGASIDALKLVSSLTLFEHVAHELRDSDPAGQGVDAWLAIEKLARDVLDAAASQGYPPCDFTRRQIVGG